MTAPGGDVEDLEIRLLLEGIHERYGYDLRNYAPASMRRRVLAALSRSGCESLGALQHLVLSDAGAFARVLDDLTVRVTEMFRDPSFYRAFRERIVPHLRTYPVVRVWHAGCASGEEVYATAILLSEEGLYERAQLFASDLSGTALAQARQGTYDAAQLGDAVRNHRDGGAKRDFAAYCTEAYGQFTMSDTLRRNVFFFQHDLVSDQAFGEMQVVLCRNVLIYFDADLKHRVVTKLAASLRPGGFLCLGSGERLPRSCLDLGLVEHDASERIYRYGPEGSA
jgi:chemotaxis protein methyltransferase CheR